MTEIDTEGTPNPEVLGYLVVVHVSCAQRETVVSHARKQCYRFSRSIESHDSDSIRVRIFQRTMDTYYNTPVTGHVHDETGKIVPGKENSSELKI